MEPTGGRSIHEHIHGREYASNRGRKCCSGRVECSPVGLLKHVLIPDGHEHVHLANQVQEVQGMAADQVIGMFVARGSLATVPRRSEASLA